MNLAKCLHWQNYHSNKNTEISIMGSWNLAPIRKQKDLEEVEDEKEVHLSWLGLCWERKFLLNFPTMSLCHMWI